MDKTALKVFAVAARRKLIEQVKEKAFAIGITAQKIIPLKEVSDDYKLLDPRFTKQRAKLLAQIEQNGYAQVMEEVAYTWFNRFIVLRFMEVNGYLSTGVKVISSPEQVKNKQYIIQEAQNIDLDVDQNLISHFLDTNDIRGLYNYLLIAQCNALNSILSFIFEKVAGYAEILLPNNLLQEGSVISDLVEIIPEKDWEQVEIIGWLYQYYISEKKAQIIGAKKEYEKAEISLVTQLFTPKWLVKYMVQNSLGRYWLEAHPEQQDLKAKWDFYLENVDFTGLKSIVDRELRVEDIKFYDPACGAGHILVYAFELFYDIYMKCGYREEDIPRLIVEKNLYGLDIDDRTYQLAVFSLVMKAIKFNKKLLKELPKKPLNLNIVAVQETNIFTEEDIRLVAGADEGQDYNKTKEFINNFQDAKVYGALINIEEFDKDFFLERLEEIKHKAEKIETTLARLIEQGEIMADNYDVLVTNPPYLSSKYMNCELKKFINKNYNSTRFDLFSCFMDYCLKKVNYHGQLGFLTPYVWMFITSYEYLRKEIVENKTISSLIQLEYNAFEAACVPVCALTIRNYKTTVQGEYIKLSAFKGVENQAIKVLEAIKNPTVEYRYSAYTEGFSKIPNYPIAYWSSERIKEIFQNQPKIGQLAVVKQGMSTSNNERFLRLWFEIELDKMGFGMRNRQEALASKRKWFPYNKGGAFRKWYGNNIFIVNWENDGQELKEYTATLPQGTNVRLKSKEYYFQPGITWSFISSITLGARYSPKGFIFDVAGSTIFAKQDVDFYLLGFLGSKIAEKCLEILNPTLNYQIQDIKNLPLMITNDQKIKQTIINLTKGCIEISKNDWDSYEISWDFLKDPLLMHKSNAQKIGEAYKNWEQFKKVQFMLLKQKEIKLNQAFLKIYGLQAELTPDVEDKNVTINRANEERDIKAFISYAVGCMFGRYSLDEDGVIYAGGKFSDKWRVENGEWRIKTNAGWKRSSIRITKHNIIPITEGGYFEDDILKCFIEFVQITFGAETLPDNLEYIAQILGKKAKETAHQCLRRYFLKDFYKDHVQIYRKRPIYWLFDSGRNNDFKALIYMHRYDKATVSRLRVEYLHKLQDKLEAENRSKDIITIDEAQSAENKVMKRSDKLTKQIKELKEYDKILKYLADQQIVVDLDLGVQVNYGKFGAALAKISKV